MISVLVPTPANGHVNVEVLFLAEHGNDQQAVQVDALHQQPVVVGHYAVLHHHHGTTTPRHSLTHIRIRDKQQAETPPRSNKDKR